MVKLLVTGALPLTESLRSKLEALGADITYVQNELAPLEIAPSQFEVVICNGLFLHNDIDRFSALRFIQATSAGLDRLPLEKIATKGIKLCNARGVYSIPMAEWALGKILELYKHSASFFGNQLQRSWAKDRNIRELAGSNAAVVGFGSVGREVAARLTALGVAVTAVDIVPVADYNFCLIEKLGQLLPDTDIVVLTLPLTDATRGLFNKSLFNTMKQNAILVNISRGGVICENDLAESLHRGHLGGAALDVFEQEPLNADSPLWALSNVIVTPHNSFVSDKNAGRLEKLIVANFSEYCHAK